MKLGDFVKLQRGHDLPAQSRKPGPIPIMGSFGITGYHNVACADGPGVTIGRSGASFGVVSYSSEPFWPLNTALYVVDFHGNDERFAYYFLKQFDFTRYNSGSAQPSLNRNFIHPIPVRVPPLEEQCRIAHILGTLDDTIDLNRQMNRTLEAISRTIFKSWFVDFDPVHAKAEGREPVGMDPETAALFPDSFQDSPLGKIPKGWKVSTVGKEFDVLMGQSPPGSTYNEAGEGLPFFQGRRNFGFRFPTKRVFCTAPKRIAEEGDTLVSVRAPVGDVNMAPAQLCLGRGLAGVRHNSGSRSYTYYSMLSLSDSFREYESEGTVFGAINKNQFAGLDWIAPPTDLVKTFETHLAAVDESIRLNEIESRQLALARDVLLPRLLSGGTRLAAEENVDAND